MKDSVLVPASPSGVHGRAALSRASGADLPRATPARPARSTAARGDPGPGHAGPPAPSEDLALVRSPRATENTLRLVLRRRGGWTKGGPRARQRPPTPGHPRRGCFGGAREPPPGPGPAGRSDAEGDAGRAPAPPRPHLPEPLVPPHASDSRSSRQKVTRTAGQAARRVTPVHRRPGSLRVGAGPPSRGHARRRETPAGSRPQRVRHGPGAGGPGGLRGPERTHPPSASL